MKFDLVKFVMSSVLVVLSLTTVSQAQPSPGSTLEQYIGANPLICQSKGFDGPIALKVKAGQILVAARDSRKAKYYVYAAKVNQANLVIALQNDVDGPLAQSVVILPLASLDLFARHNANLVRGFLAFHEGFNGTRGSDPLICR